MMRGASLLGVCVGALLSVLFVMSGLFGLDMDALQVNLDAPSSSRQYPTEPTTAFPKAFDRLVLVVIDALRADMVLGNEAIGHHHGEDLSLFMPYTTHLARSSEHTVAYIAHAAVPTVTMPRLKALTTGKQPAFLDVLRNFNSKALDDDNLLARFHQAGRRLVLYGDETWLSLFPDLFHRHDATSGFFTTDTVEVDTNVTRHLQDELDPTMQSPKSLDWDVLVLHYLGVDHIGHLEGPHSPRMKHKLGEMDAVMRSIRAAIAAQDARRDGLPTLLVLCSDHGMTETGNHGGASIEESSALLLFVLPSTTTTKKKTTHRTLQVDLVPTLAALFGLPIPTSNTGKMLTDVLDAAAAVATPDALRRNVAQLVNLVRWSPADRRAFETTTLPTLALDDALATLQTLVLQSDGSEYNGAAIAAGVACAVAAAALAVATIATTTSLTCTHAALGVGAVVHMASLGSSSAIENEHATWNFLLTSLWFVLGLRELAASTETRRSSSHAGLVRRLGLLVLLAATTRVLRSRNQVINFGRLNDLAPTTLLDGSAAPGFEYETDDSLSIYTTRSLLDTAAPIAEQLVAVVVVAVYGLSRTHASLALGASFVAGLAAVAAFHVDPATSVYAHLVYGTSGLLVVAAMWHQHVLPLEFAAWLLGLLLQRASHAMSLAVLALQLACFGAYARADVPVDVVAVTGLWLSKAGFFALGNSHLMTTIDISTAYTGLTAYSPAIVGGLTCVIVMTAPTVVLLATVGAVVARRRDVVAVVWVVELATFAVYSVVVYAMRFHLFIWSVFAPKMMYHMAFLVWHIVMTLVVLAGTRASTTPRGPLASFPLVAGCNSRETYEDDGPTRDLSC
ncbi:Aste57867_18587 [Aphanomyces stellatus]|uniref:Aste57867_18587 protein n=1 Tax=Aphanomyces stellatus TaxID=120398 RepID=A0A485LB37_9STRA|nr:hypothetical protein As57867_018525 [Aphanomyces stellatus]VFT95322.1 Aste57867_18587 [Aphanomyces stellatus]